MRIFLVLILAAICGTAGWFLGSRYGESPANLATETETVSLSQAIDNVNGLGKLEPASGVIKILAPQGQKIETLFDLRVGDRVEQDQPLVRLAAHEARQLELNIATAKRNDAFNQLEMEKSKGDFKQDSAKLALQQAASLEDKINDKAVQLDHLTEQRNAAQQQLQRMQNLDTNPLTTNMIGTVDLEKQRLLVASINAKITDAEQQKNRAFKMHSELNRRLRTI